MDGTQTQLRDTLEGSEWPGEIAQDLAESAHTVTYERGAAIFHAGERADLLYILLEGEVKLYYSNASGDRLLVGIVHSGEMLGLMDLTLDGAAGEATQLFSAEALSRCKVAIVTKSRAAAATRRIPQGQMVKIMQRMNQGWVHLCNRLLTFMTMDVRRRLAYAISEIAEAFGIPDARGALIRLRLSHEDLSELVGASRPMVSKHLKEFAKAGIFFKQNGRYIVSKEALAGSLDSAMAVDTRDGRLLRQAQRQAPRPSSRRPHAGGGRSQPSAGRALRATS